MGFGFFAFLAACGAAYIALRHSRKRPEPREAPPFPPYDWFYEESLELPPPPRSNAPPSA
jgi:hypothetical protein